MASQLASSRNFQFLELKFNSVAYQGDRVDEIDGYRR